MPQGLRTTFLLSLLAALLLACTHEVPRDSIQVRHYRVDWSRLNAPVLQQGSLAIRGILLTPAQWPLEASLKRLRAGDFEGVIDALDLRFHSSSIPSGVLQDLYDLGYIPAYVRIENRGTEPAWFDPRRLVVRINPWTALPRVGSHELPQTVTELDWQRTGAGVALTALSLATGKDAWEGPGSDQSTGDDASYGGIPSLNLAGKLRDQVRGDSTTGSRLRPEDGGLLERQPVAPGNSVEGYVLFALIGPVPDWSQARLELLR